MAQNYNVQINRFNGTDYDTLMPKNILTGTSDPTTSTVGIVGQFYLNTKTNNVFICQKIVGSVYTWGTISILPKIVVTVKSGAVVTCTDGITTLTGISTGTYTFNIPNYGTWTVSATLNGNTSDSVNINIDTVKIYTASLSFIRPVLNDNSWSIIQEVAQASTGSNYWAVGDAKQITLNGKVGSTNYSNYNIWVYILGFNHNASVEGNNRIHFGLGRTAQTYSTTNGIALTDTYYSTSTSVTGAYTMNTTNTNTGGWASSHMRQTILQASGTPTSPISNTFLSVLSSDLRSAMVSCSKWTDNTGGGSGSSTPSYVTATTDYVWLLAEYEIFGSIENANTYEKNHQSQYQYYINSNSKVKYQSLNTENAANWWERSPYIQANTAFCAVLSNGNKFLNGSLFSYGIAPSFAIG